MINFISTKNLIYLTLFFSPVYLIKFSVFNIPLNLLDILILFTLAVWVHENKLNLFKKIKKSLEKTSSILLPVFFILLGLFASTLLNDNFLKELGIIKSWFLLPIAFGFIVFNETQRITTVKKILDTLFFSSFFISIIGLFYLLFGKLTYDGRLSAFYLSPNHLAMILVLGFLIGFWDIVKDKKINIFKLIYLFPILFALFFTHSYGAWLSLFISSLIILFFTHRKTILILVIIFLIFLISEYSSPKFYTIFHHQEQSSLNSRLVIWQVSKKIISDNWLWGIGPGNFQEKYLDYQKYFPPYPEWAVPQPHNLFLAFWLQAGLLGLFGFLYLTISWGIKKIKILIFSKDLHKKSFSLIVLTIVFATLLHGLIDTPYWKNDLSLVFWSIIYLGLSLKYLPITLNDNSK
ncbi:MAG: O-antigen ligase family protein [Candidatus Moranbacteria bacterium]|nr:O-antigen ligase family protein [Candidatus Moranbacteria bacterium]